MGDFRWQADARGWGSADTVIGEELAPDERLLWPGKPRQGLVLRASDAVMVPFSLLWGGFAIFWEAMALTMAFSGEEPTPMPVAIILPLFGVPFVVVGLYLIFGRFFVDARIRARTFYGATDQRIIIVSGLFSRKVKSLNLRTLTDVSLTEKSDGTGTITFGPSHPFAWCFGGMHRPGTPQAPPSFEMIPDARTV